jgi:hypothetical protein
MGSLTSVRTAIGVLKRGLGISGGTSVSGRNNEWLMIAGEHWWAVPTLRSVAEHFFKRLNPD